MADLHSLTIAFRAQGTLSLQYNSESRAKAAWEALKLPTLTPDMMDRGLPAPAYEDKVGRRAIRAIDLLRGYALSEGKPSLVVGHKLRNRPASGALGKDVHWPSRKLFAGSRCILAAHGIP